MTEIANAPLEGNVVGRVLGYELAIGEYEDVQALGQYDTEDEALIALGRYVMAHGREVGALYPSITPIG